MEPWRGHPVRQEIVRLAGREFDILLPADADALLDDPRVQRRFDRDEYMPYWATLWPGALLLAEVVARWPEVSAGAATPSVLELGCGLGLAGLVAASLGYRVMLSDYDEDALAFAAENARRNGLTIEAVRVIDWRREYPDLRLDRILAADVLYEARNLDPVATFIARHLAPGGLALVADANRSTADPFERVARDADLSVAVQHADDPSGPPGVPVRGRVYHLTVPMPTGSRGF